MIVGIAGGSGAGKTTFVQRLVGELPHGSTTVLSHDAYYRDLRHLALNERASVNFDHPDSLETDLLVEHLGALRRGCSVRAPVYDFATHTRSDSATRIDPRATVIVEGILLLAHAPLRELLDVAVYIDVEDDARLARRMQRDVSERARSPESVLRQWQATVRPMHDAFVRPTIAHADIIVPRGGANEAAARVIAAYVTSG